ncbi:MAG: hypothetical protein ABR581_08115 [Thermoleophilaceae bacterium]
MPPNHQAPISLSSVRDRVAQRRALLQAAAARPQATARSGGRAWINGREVAPDPRLAHLYASYD